MRKKIKVKYLRDVFPIKPFDKGNWIDLRAGKEMFMQEGKYYAIPLGVAMELPKGYEAIIAPRSSTFKHWGILAANSIGIVDESYKGDKDEWHFLVYACRDTMVYKNERICQFRIVKHQPTLRIQAVDMLGNANRGGIGSSGRS